MVKELVCLCLSILLVFGCCGCSTETAGPETVPAQEHLAQWKNVEEAVCAASLSETKRAVCIRAEAPEHAKQLVSRKEASVSYPFIKYCEQMDSNPISAFYALKKAGLFDSDYWYDYASEGLFGYVDAYSEYVKINEIVERTGLETIKHYVTGRDEAVFIRDVLNTSAMTDDGMDLEAKILETTRDLTKPGLHESEEDQVSYIYYIYETDFYASVLCIYIHHDEDRELIGDVEFQMLTLYYYTNQLESEYDEDWSSPYFSAMSQLLSLIDAIEMNLTGTSVFHQSAALNWSTMHGGSVDIPAAYEIGDYDITVSRKYYDSHALGTRGDGLGYETAVLTNYRICKGT